MNDVLKMAVRPCVSPNWYLGIGDWKIVDGLDAVHWRHVKVRGGAPYHCLSTLMVDKPSRTRFGNDLGDEEKHLAWQSPQVRSASQGSLKMLHVDPQVSSRTA